MAFLIKVLASMRAAPRAAAFALLAFGRVVGGLGVFVGRGLAVVAEPLGRGLVGLGSVCGRGLAGFAVLVGRGASRTAVGFAAAVATAAKAAPRLPAVIAAAACGLPGALRAGAIGSAFRVGGIAGSARALPSTVRAVAKGDPRRSELPVWMRLAHMALVVALVAGITSGGRHLRPGQSDSEALAETAPMAMLDEWARGKHIDLEPARSAPVPASDTLAKEGPLRPREVFAFAPWWTLESVGGVDVRGLTTIAYFGVDVGPGGRLIRGGAGWEGFQSQALVDLINRAHRNGTRVVLTAKSFDADVLRSVLSDRMAATRLANELAWTIRLKKFDGVNFDFEFFGDTYKDRFTRFITDVTNKLRAIDKSWQITIDTYASSAQIADGFFDVRRIAKAVDALFVMGYDMYRSGIASPNAPLPRYEDSIRAYTALAPASKIIYGTPFYGYDWPTKDNRPNSPAVGPSTPKTYSEIVAERHPRYWDASASVPWTAYKVGNQWHEIYYDDPSSLALKARLADRYRLRGLGAWALRMDHHDRSLIGALTGALSSIVLSPSGPAVGGTSGAPAGPTPTRTTTTSTAPKPKPKPKPATSPSPSPSPSSSPLPVPVPTPALP